MTPRPSFASQGTDTMSTAPQRARSKLAGLYRGGHTDHDADVQQARLDLRESLLMDAIRKHADAAPPLPAERRLRIAAILCNPAGGADAS
jgi:hypothetical protein